MKFYCGIDLSARDCNVCVIDEQLKIVFQQSRPTICRDYETAAALSSPSADRSREHFQLVLVRLRRTRRTQKEKAS